MHRVYIPGTGRLLQEGQVPVYDLKCLPIPSTNNNPYITGSSAWKPLFQFWNSDSKMITSFFVPKVTRDLTNRTEAKRAREIPESSKTETGKKPKLSEVDEMLSYLDDDINKENSWKTALERHTSSQSFGDLAKFLASERCVQHVSDFVRNYVVFWINLATTINFAENSR